MLRRRASVAPVALHTSVRVAARSEGRLHTFIRDNSNVSKRGPFSERGTTDDGRGSHRSGETEASRASTLDWAAQMQRELLSDTDPLYGLAHKDYYRDPATGFSPQYAPRNFSRGGEIAYPYLNSAHDYADAAARRHWLDHEVENFGQKAHAAREVARSLNNSEERAAYLANIVPADQLKHYMVENQSRQVVDQLHNHTVTSGDKLRQQSIIDRYRASGTEAPLSYSSTLDRDTLHDVVRQHYSAANDDQLDEHLRLAHGLRHKERFDFNIMQRTARLPFKGYDMDRFKAQQMGTPYGAQKLPPSMPTSSMEEARKTLCGTSLPSTDDLARKAYARNTVSNTPVIGEGLTENIVESWRASRSTQSEQATQERNRRFGLGRQGALVQDGGPDKRVLKKHVNDERLVDALMFSSDAYRRTPTDEHSNPYYRGNTQRGVGHLLNNNFDIQRREHRISEGKQDLTERSIMHYGVPIQQTVDEFVFRHRNARGERPLDYFKPFPSFRACRLNARYNDTEGFSMMKQRPEFLEWELFTRYRAHHQQRRDLALLHGLEPMANETAQEREARRLALDKVCERTAFDASRITLNDDETKVDVETLRNWFGVYVLPSPSVTEAVLGTEGSVSLHLQHLSDATGSADMREHVLSSRYLNKLLLFEGYQNRLMRGFVNDTVGRAPEPVIKYAQPAEVLRHFTAEEQAMYQEYVKAETDKQLKEWERIAGNRRFIAAKGCYGKVETQGYTTAVVDVRHQESGGTLTIATKQFESELQASAKNKGLIQIDGEMYAVEQGSHRHVIPLSVRLESGEVMETTNEEFEQYPLEVDASAKYNHALNYGVADYTYNRGNYIETQDVLWEERTASGEEGWSPATHADGLRANLPVRARRQLNPTESTANGEPRCVGDPQRGRIVEYLKQPFFNPEPRLVTIEFASDGEVQQVPLSDVFIWQRRYHGPERTVGDDSRRHSQAGLRRFVDVADPNNEKGRRDDGTTEHFLDKYEVRNAETAAAKYRTMKQITEIDNWTKHDTRRADNYRPLSISHRRDYIRQGYMHRFTPWEWITIQEADQPIIKETIREDDVGASHFFSLNRYWRYKARPHGYIRNFENEVRDLFQYVDGVTPWKQAQKIRTYWEVRQHHPMPQFNRPEVAMHRNTAGLLPAHMWETDKKTGKVKAVKDSVRDYQTKTEFPKWVQL